MAPTLASSTARLVRRSRTATTPAASGKWKYLAIEVQDAAGGGAPAIPPILIMQTRRAY